MVPVVPLLRMIEPPKPLAAVASPPSKEMLPEVPAVARVPADNTMGAVSAPPVLIYRGSETVVSVTPLADGVRATPPAVTVSPPAALTALLKVLAVVWKVAPPEKVEAPLSVDAPVWKSVEAMVTAPAFAVIAAALPSWIVTMPVVLPPAERETEPPAVPVPAWTIT